MNYKTHQANVCRVINKMIDKRWTQANRLESGGENSDDVMKEVELLQAIYQIIDTPGYIEESAKSLNVALVK